MIIAWTAVALIVALLCVYAVVTTLRHRGKLRCLQVENRLPVDIIVSNPMYCTGDFEHSGDPFEGSLILLREWIELEDEIGEGFFGKVYRGRLKHSNGQAEDFSYINVEDELVAVKKLKPVNANLVHSLNDDLIREATTVASFSHPNILALKGVVFNGIYFKY